MHGGEVPTSTGQAARGVAMIALLAGLAAVVAGFVWLAVDDAATAAVPLVAVGFGFAAFGALLLVAAPLYGGEDGEPSSGRRFAQVAVPVVAAGLVAPAIAVVSARALDGLEADGGSRVVAGGVPSGAPAAGGAATTMPTGASGSSATMAGGAAGEHQHSSAGQAGMAPAGPISTVSPQAMGSLEDQLTAAIQANGGLPADATGGTAGGAATTSIPVTAPAAGATATPGGVLAGQITSHQHGEVIPEQPLDKATRAALGEQLAAARQVAEAFPTVADAERAGYVMVTPYVPLIGAHYVKWGFMDGMFDVAHPEMLLYDGTDPDSGIVGLSYYAFGGNAPEGFAGPNDHWHQHLGLCLKAGVVVADESATSEQCSALGGQKVDGANGWMVHAWVVPGWDSPQGVFSPEHPGLT